jgi:hypothetical protein
LFAMHLTLVQALAIAARMALIVGAEEFDRLFLGVQFSEVDGDILFVYALDEDRAAEMEDSYALHISIIAKDILKREISIVMVLPRVAV